MYKKSSLLFFAAVVFTACGNTKTPTNSTNTTSTENKTIVRDISITQANAYNDIFLDSSDVEKFIATEKLDNTMATAFRDFYNVRNFEYAWFASNGLTEQSLSFHSQFCTENNCDLFDKSLEDRLDRMRVEEDTTINAKDPIIIKSELQITQRFLKYRMENEKNNFSAAALGTYIPAQKVAVLSLADAALADKNNTNNPLKPALQKYVAIAKAGGWPVIVADKKKYAPGAAGPVIYQVKKRLQITGEYTAADTTDVLNPTLEAALSLYRQNHGYKPTTDITEGLIKDLNISANARVGQLLMNIYRRHWMPAPVGGRLIIVNIPEFVLYVDSAGTNLFKMDVVVGKEGHNTTMFNGQVSQVVFSPYWNVPPSIVKKEILPAMAKDKNYLDKKDMEITGQEGGLPAIRQKPGDKNALGRVKFLFPNSFNIYMHDTPEKGLFQRTTRSLSHGCIRLSDPPKMARYILQNQPEWTPEKIEEAMNAGVEKVVKVKKPIPVIITYYTTWVDDAGVLHFADDIYDHDRKMAAKMFIN